MLKRVHIKGYKSLVDVEVNLKRLSVLMGPNMAGKSNFLDALQLLSKIATRQSIEEAFDPPYRGNRLESFSFGKKGIDGLTQHEHLRFSIEADIELSETTMGAVNRLIREMLRPSDESERQGDGQGLPRVRERNLRYRVEIGMLPDSGILRVEDEYLAPLNSRGELSSRRQPFIEKRGGKMRLRREGRSHPVYHDLLLNHTILSMSHYAPHHPHVVAARREFENWLFFYFEPRERMRATNPVKGVRHLGMMGEDLAAFLHILKMTAPRHFKAVARALHILMPRIDGIETEVNALGEVELRIIENGVAMSARVVSEGTLRILGLLALAGAEDPPALIGFEEPENGVHPRRIRQIADMLQTQELRKQTQYIVTTHSPILADLMEDDALFIVNWADDSTRIEPFSFWGPLGRRPGIKAALEDTSPKNKRGWLPISERILRGDFDA